MHKRHLFFIFLVILLLSQITFAAGPKSPSEINALYYNLSESRLQSFQCRVATDAFDQIKERVYPGLSEAEQKALDQIQFHLSYENGNLNFETTDCPKFENDNTTQGMKKVLDGIKLMVTGVFTSWKGVIAEPMIAGNEKFQIKENNRGYLVTYQQAGNDVKLQFDTNYLLVQASFQMEDQTVVILPEFIPTNEGLLIKKIDLNIGSDQIREIIEINYQDFKGIPLPIELNIKIDMGQVKQDAVIKCFDYQVETD